MPNDLTGLMTKLTTYDAHLKRIGSDAKWMNTEIEDMISHVQIMIDAPAAPVDLSNPDVCPFNQAACFPGYRDLSKRLQAGFVPGIEQVRNMLATVLDLQPIDRAEEKQPVEVPQEDVVAERSEETEG